MSLQFPERPLQPPEPALHAILDGEAQDERKREANADAMSELLRGCGPFWWQSKQSDNWNNEQELAVFEAVGKALRDGCGPELFRLRVLAAVASEGLKYAAYVAGETE